MPLNGPSRQKLDQACEAANIADIQSILLSYKDPDLHLPDDLPAEFRALYIAACEKEQKATFLLLQFFKARLTPRAINASLLKDNVFTLLMLACHYNWIDVVGTLVDLPGTDVNLLSNTGASALYHAVLVQHSDCAKKLLAHSKIIIENNSPKEGEPTVFIKACMLGLSELVMLMLEKGGVDVNYLCKVPTNLAHHEKMPFLTPLRLALQGAGVTTYCNLDAIKALVRHGAELTVKGAELVHPNEICDKIIPDVLPYLQRIKVLRAAQEFVQTPEMFKLKKELFIAIKNDQPELIRSILGKQPKLLTALNEFDEPPKEGDSPLHYACRLGHSKAVAELLKVGDNPNKIKGDKSITPLILASQEGHNDVVKQLLAAGAIVDFRKTDNSKDNALTAASANGRHEVVISLLAAKADINYVNSLGSTCLDIALAANKPDVVKVLRGKAALTAAELKLKQNGQPIIVAPKETPITMKGKELTPNIDSEKALKKELSDLQAQRETALLKKVAIEKSLETKQNELSQIKMERANEVIRLMREQISIGVAELERTQRLPAPVAANNSAVRESAKPLPPTSTTLPGVTAAVSSPPPNPAATSKTPAMLAGTTGFLAPKGSNGQSKEAAINGKQNPSAAKLISP